MSSASCISISGSLSFSFYHFRTSVKPPLKYFSLWMAEILNNGFLGCIMQEHLLIVCELLKANLYEFHKFNRESGGEVYFTMPRLQVCSLQHYLPA